MCKQHVQHLFFFFFKGNQGEPMAEDAMAQEPIAQGPIAQEPMALPQNLVRTGKKENNHYSNNCLRVSTMIVFFL